jgi:hypothetical protein
MRLTTDETAALMFAGIAVIVVAFLFGSIYVLGGMKCAASWKDSGFPSEYTFFGGCRISEDGGKTWIPSDRWRAIEGARQ